MSILFALLVLAAPPTAVVHVPSEAAEHAKIIIDASESDGAASYVWLPIELTDDAVERLDGGSRLAVWAAPGTYHFALVVASETGEQAGKVIELTIRPAGAGDDEEPPRTPETPSIADRVAAIVSGEPELIRLQFARNYALVAGVQSVTQRSQLEILLRAKNSDAVAALDTAARTRWQRIGEQLSDLAAELQRNGRLQTIDDYRSVYLEFAKGLER